MRGSERVPSTNRNDLFPQKKGLRKFIIHPYKMFCRRHTFREMSS